MCVVADIYVIQDNRILDVAVIADKGFFENNGILHRSVDDAAAGNQAVGYLYADVVLRGRKVVHLGIDIRILTEEIVPDLRLQEIHVGGYSGSGYP